VSLEKDIDKIKDDIDNLVKIQCTDPTVTKEHEPYMVGLANGLLIGKAVIDGSEPKFHTPRKNDYENEF